RVMKLAPNGDIILSEPQAGKVMVMRPSSDGKTAATVATFAEGLKLPFGIAFYPDATRPQWIYVAETNRVVRYHYHVGDL
ncbi:MAG: sorbosone dehydrogenase family protein, partial [Steroidobacter sp.]